jgi:hypothetical protein
VGVYATITGVMSDVGAVFAIVLTAQAGGPVIFLAVAWSLAVLFAALGLYSSWALLGGQM